MLHILEHPPLIDSLEKLLGNCFPSEYIFYDRSALAECKMQNDGETCAPVCNFPAKHYHRCVRAVINSYDFVHN